MRADQRPCWSELWLLGDKKEKVWRCIEPVVQVQEKHLFWGRVWRLEVGSILWSFIGEGKERSRQWKLKILQKLKNTHQKPPLRYQKKYQPFSKSIRLRKEMEERDKYHFRNKNQRESNYLRIICEKLEENWTLKVSRENWFDWNRSYLRNFGTYFSPLVSYRVIIKNAKDEHTNKQIKNPNPTLYLISLLLLLIMILV